MQDLKPAAETCRCSFFLGVASVFNFLFMNHTGRRGGWQSCGGHCYVLRLSMIKSGSCGFSQYFGRSPEPQGPSDLRVGGDYFPAHHSNC